MMKIKLPDEATTERVAAELLNILVNVRDKTIKCSEHGGFIHKQNLKYWSEKADLYLETLKQYEVKNNTPE